MVEDGVLILLFEADQQIGDFDLSSNDQKLKRDEKKKIRKKREKKKERRRREKGKGRKKKNKKRKRRRKEKKREKRQTGVSD